MDKLQDIKCRIIILNIKRYPPPPISLSKYDINIK